jgi:thiol:disulfide interchange protein DsbC
MPKLSFTFTIFFLAATVMLTTHPVSAAGLDLSKALKIGTGKTMVIEFTDPDCPYCRRGAAFFKGRTDVTRYIFFNPLPMHPHAREKAACILSSPDPAKTCEEVFAGKLDNTSIPAPSAAGARLLETHMAIAREEGVHSTPTYIICGRIIHGFDQNKIEQLLGQ